MGKTFRYYTLLRPLRDRYVDDGSSVMALVPVTHNGQSVELALIGSPGDPRMIRVSVTGIDEEPAYDVRKRFDDLTESMLALLRVFCNNEISLSEPRFRYGNLLDDGLPPALNMVVRTTLPTYNFDPEFAVAFMHSDKEFRDIVRLFADVIHPYLSVQYRYLSAFKILEHDFKLNRRKWKPELDVLLSNFTEEYAALRLSGMGMKAFMIDLRDKCAHIKLGDADKLTIVGIGSPDTELAIRFLPLLIKVIQKHVFDAYKSDGAAFRAVGPDFQPPHFP